MGTIANPFTTEADLKRRLRRHLKSLGFSHAKAGGLELSSESKETFRFLHRKQWAERLAGHKEFIRTRWPKLGKHFASGSEVRPDRISPSLELVEAETWQSDLFRLATLTWSIPVSNGYGRRMRFLVWDGACEKLIGVVALTDPVFNLRVRDNRIGWTGDDRKERLAFMLDAHVLGALPPYNMLLGGKMVACLIRSQEIRDAFREKYAQAVGIISHTSKKPQLVAVTTSSALGRSSLYNRLALGGTRYFEPIGYTLGFGHFHISQPLFERMRNYLESISHSYANENKFGAGPNWKMRVIRACLASLGMNGDILKHNLKREVFLCVLADNASEVLTGFRKKPKWDSLKSCGEIGDLARERWMVERAKNRPEYAAWKRDGVLELIRKGYITVESAAKEQAHAKR
jgi:hypothetical protein